MKKKAYFTIVLVMVLGGAHIVFGAPSESETSREYQIKAAFLFNFFKFVDWPIEKTPNSNEPFTIGVIGKDPFGKSLEPIENKKVKGRKVVIKKIRSFQKQESSERKDTIKALRKCHLLFISSSKKENLTTIIEAVQDASILTVGETAGFLESGGIINFVMEDKKVRFEINNFAAKQASLKIRSRLLRLARRVIEEKPSGDTKK